MKTGVGAKKGMLGEGTISDEALRAWEDRIGMELRISNLFNRVATCEAIRNYVNGIGDDNPLYRDQTYAIGTRYGRLAAPPGWLYSVFPTWVAQGLPGVHIFVAGNDWRFYKPVFMGETISPVCRFMGFEVKPSRFAQKTVFEYQQSNFYNERRELVARTNALLMRAERAKARERGKYGHVELPHPFSDKDLESIDEQVLSEEVRGSEPRFWEDVEVGEELPAVVKGPLGLTDMIAYFIGALPVQMAAHSTQLRYYRRHAAMGFRDPETKAWESVHSVHYSKTAAKAAGLPYPFDEGAQRQGWLMSAICNWMGDEAWLKKNSAVYKRFVFISDVVSIRGKVSSKYIDDDGESCVDIQSVARNQRGENTMDGASTVVLPSRGTGNWPLKGRV